VLRTWGCLVTGFLKSLKPSANIGLSLLAAGVGTAGTAVVEQVISQTPASAAESYGWLYRTADADCVYYDDFTYSTGTNIGTYAFFDYSYFGVYNYSCSVPYPRPPGNLDTQATWYKNGSECTYTNPITNQGTADNVVYAWNGNMASLCGGSIDSYTDAAWHYEWNGAQWVGGEVYPEFGGPY
jgi:hypothetical protein